MRERNNEKGFSYLDVMVGMVILLIGITALVAAITGAVIRAHQAQQQLMAKQIASSTLESIFSARDIARDGVIDTGMKGWRKVGNVGTNPDPVTGIPQGIFFGASNCTDGFCPVREDAGWDGVVGTADDACPGLGSCSDGVNPANTSVVLQDFHRKITITDINDPDRPSPPAGTWPIMMRRIDIEVKYPGITAMQIERVSTIMTFYRQDQQ